MYNIIGEIENTIHSPYKIIKEIFMNTQCAENMMCKMKDCMKKLCSMKVRDNFDFSMSLTDTDGGNCFSKTMKSDTEFSLVKCLIGLIALGVAMSAICCAFHMRKCHK